MNILNPTTHNPKKNRNQRRKRPTSVDEVLRSKQPGGQGIRRKVERLILKGRLTKRFDGTLVRKKTSRKWRQSFAPIRDAQAEWAVRT